MSKGEEKNKIYYTQYQPYSLKVVSVSGQEFKGAFFDSLQNHG